MTWRIALQLALSGLSVGSICAIVALSLAIPFKASRVLNFAQGEVVTLGAYIALIMTRTACPIRSWCRRRLLSPRYSVF